MPTPRPRHRRPAAALLDIGGLTSRKNVALALRSLAQTGRPATWHYDIVGDGEEAPELRRIAEEAGITGAVTFHGRRADVAEFYRQADIFLFPSLADNAHLVVMEAMSWGLPVIALDDAAPGVNLCNRAVISHAENGLLASSTEEYRQ
jgi:glycosyltransferase involved in cell wall biosynthesis